MKTFIQLLFFLLIGFTSFGQLAMSGTFTIDPSIPASTTNFESFAQFANRLNNFGVVGPVIVNVKEGTYPERLKLTEITNSSTANTVLVQADPTNTNEVLLIEQARLDTGVVDLIDVENFTMKDIHVETSAHQGYTVYIRGISNNLLFEGIEVNVSTGAGSGSARLFRVSTTELGPLGIRIVDSEFHNARDCVGLQTTPANSPNASVEIEGCTFLNYKGTGVSANSVTNFSITNSTFERSLVANLGNDISCQFSGTTNPTCIISNNKIKMTSNGTYAIRLSSIKSQAIGDVVLRNNFIHSKEEGNKTAFFIQNVSRGVLENNTVRIENDGTGIFRGLEIKGGASSDSIIDFKVRNNIWSLRNRREVSDYVHIYPLSAFIQVDFANNLYAGLPNRSRWIEYNTFSPIEMYTLSEWENYSGETNAITGDPQFYRASDFHLESPLVSNVGVNTPFLAEDLDGDVRPSSVSGIVDIGADEFDVPACQIPEFFQVTAVDTSAISVGWTSSGSNWAVIYGAPGFDPLTQGTRVEVNTTYADISGLITQSTYEFYVRTLCGPDSSVIRGPISASTFGLGVYLDYEMTCGLGAQNMSDAAPIIIGGESTLFSLPFPMVVGGNEFTDLMVYENGGVSLDPNQGLDTSFYLDYGLYVFGQELEQDSYTLDSSEGVYWQVFGSVPNRTLVIEWRGMSTSEPGANVPGKARFQMSYNENEQDLYFHYVDVEFGDETRDFGLDAAIGYHAANEVAAVSINESDFLLNNTCLHLYPTNCTRPQNLKLIASTNTSLEIGWDDLIDLTTVTVVYGEEGFDPTLQGTTVAVTSNPQVFSNLNVGVSYDFYFVSNCNNGLVSDTNFIQLSTQKDCATPSDLYHFFVGDSMRLYYDWQTHDPQILSTGFNLTYSFVNSTVEDGTTSTVGNQLGDTLQGAWLPGGIYNMYVQAVCGDSLSNYSLPMRFKVPVRNDDPCDAVNLPVDGVTRVFNNFPSYSEQAEGAIEPPQTGFYSTDGWGVSDIDNSVWYTFTSPTAGTRFDATAIEYDGQIALYEVGLCSNFNTFTLVAANDHALDSTSQSPKFQLCNLVPGRLYYLLFDSPDFEEFGTYALTLSSLSADAGDVPVENQYICAGDSLNLFDYVVGNDNGGTWLDLFGSGSLTDSIIDTEQMPEGEFDFRYLVVDGCLRDSVKVDIINEHGELAGTGQNIVVCPNDPIFLFSNIQGETTQNGTWYDFNGNVVVNGTTQIPIPGDDFPFYYVVENDICPDDTAFVSVEVDPCGLGISENGSLAKKVYPNPTSGELIIAYESSEQVQITVRDAQGKLMLIGQMSPQAETFQLNCSEWSSGWYHIELRSNQKMEVVPFVKL